MHVAQQPPETIDPVERWVDLERDARADRHALEESRTRGTRVTLACAELRTVDLKQPDTFAGCKPKRVAVRDRCHEARSPRRSWRSAGYAGRKQKPNSERAKCRCACGSQTSPKRRVHRGLAVNGPTAGALLRARWRTRPSAPPAAPRCCRPDRRSRRTTRSRHVRD